MRLIDTHCHLCHARLRSQRDAVLDRARRAGLVAMICAAGNPCESNAAAELARQEADIYCTAGIHPHDAKDAPERYLAHIERLAGEPKNVAIGEIGLDYHYNYSPPADQQRIFAEQLELARRLGKRIVIHTRSAFADTLSILRQSGVAAENVVFHCCTEVPENIRRVLDLGARIGFSGIVTFQHAVDLRDAAKLVPPDRLLIETDSPFLSPAPVRKMRTNEPANVVHVAGCLAEVCGIGAERLAERTTANAVSFFGLDLHAP